MVSLRLLLALLCAGLLAMVPVARAEDGCAGDGEPAALPVIPSMLMGVAVLPYTGADLWPRSGDAGAAGALRWPGLARVALCGRLPLRRGALVYALGYEPYSAYEAAHGDAAPWGRILAAEAGYPILSWLTAYGGIRKLAFSYGHDEPEQALALPVRPSLSNSLAPDRRLGLTVDADWGPVRIILGLYESARALSALPRSGLLATARGVMEPLGPVGRSLSTAADDPYWRRRFRIAFNISGLVEWGLQPGAPGGFASPSGLIIGGDVPAKIGPLGVVVEYLYARSALIEGPGAAPGLRADRQGVWAQAALMLLRPCLELEGRYEWFDVPTDGLQRFHGFTAGLTGYVFRTHLKLQGAYGHKLHYGGPPVSDDYLLFMMQAAE